MSCGIDFDKLPDKIRSVARAVFAGTSPLAASRKADGSLVTGCDLAIQTAIERMLREAGDPHPLLGEEMTADDQQRVAAEPAFWCLDPLDGTTNFTAGVPFYGIALAFIRAGRVEFGLVYDPVRDENFHAWRDGGAFHNGTRIATTRRDRILARDVACVDFKRLPKALAARLVQAPPYASQRNFGACVIEWCWTAIGRFALYLHGGQRLWDHAAGALIHLEAGGALETLEGIAWCGCVQPEDFDVKRSVVAASSAAVLDQWREWRRDPIGT